jgi:hypothetical protein
LKIGFFEVKFGEVQLNLNDKMKYTNEWAKANVLRDDHFQSMPYIPSMVWNKSSANWDKGKAEKLIYPHG